MIEEIRPVINDYISILVSIHDTDVAERIGFKLGALMVDMVTSRSESVGSIP